MSIPFTIEDLKTPERLERTLRLFETAMQSIAVQPVAPALDINAIAREIRKQLQATGSAPLNLQSLLPSQGIAALLEDTHANRLVLYPAGNYPVGTTFYETDRTATYAVVSSSGTLGWQYTGGVFYSAFANRPTDLGTNDTGFLYIPSEHLHWCRWGGAAWVILDPDAGTFIDSAVALGAGWQLCDGTATSYLAISGATLVQTAITPPDENGGAAGVYHKSIAAYTAVINAAVAPGLTGATGSNTTGITVDAHAVTEIANVIGLNNWAFTASADAAHTVNDPGHTHSAGSLAVDATAQPRNMGVLRYFRR